MTIELTSILDTYIEESLKTNFTASIHGCFDYR